MNPQGEFFLNIDCFYIENGCFLNHTHLRMHIHWLLLNRRITCCTLAWRRSPSLSTSSVNVGRSCGCPCQQSNMVWYLRVKQYTSEHKKGHTRAFSKLDVDCKSSIICCIHIKPVFYTKVNLSLFGADWFSLLVLGLKTTSLTSRQPLCP